MSRLLKKYPLQTFLLLFNTGVFGYLKTISYQVSTITGLPENNISSYLPGWLTQFVGNNLNELSNFMNSSAWSWLIVSVVLTLIIRFVKGIIKLFILVIVLGVGMYLIWQNQELLSQFMH